MAEPVLVTGSTGTTGGLVADLLRARGVPVRAAARRASPGTVRLDWGDPATFAPALDGVRAAYLVAPTDRTDQLTAMRPFLEEAVRRGVGPLVLLSAASLPEGGPMMGEVHAWLRDHAPRWVVLRPSWFMQNFVHAHLPGILADGCLYSATGDGRVAFIDALDIAGVAAAALTEPDVPNGDVVITGPEPLSYDDVAAAITAASGRRVRHCRLTVEALTNRHASAGLPHDYAELLAGMDAAIADGSEDRVTDGVRRTIGRAPGSFADILTREAGRFMPAGRA